MLIPEPRFYLKDTKSIKSTMIYLQARYSINEKPQRVMLSAIDKVRLEEWDSVKQRVIVSKKNLANSEINLYLDKMASCFKSVMRNLALDNITPIASLVKERMEEMLNLKAKVEQPEVTFYSFVKTYIQESKSNKSTPTVKTYVTAFNRIKEFGNHCNKEFSFDDITLEWRVGFLSYLQEHYHIARNTEGKFIKIVKCILNEATERGINKNFAFRSKNFFQPLESVHKIFLTMAEIEAIAKVDLSEDKIKDVVRDYFIIACLTSLRFGDFTRIKKEHIQNGRIQMITNKTGQEVVIPISPLVNKVFLKYNYNLPKAPCNQIFNRYIKDIGKQAELNELITITKTIGGVKKTKVYFKYNLLSSHTGRRSLISNCILEGINSSSVMLISGHKSHRVFSSYVRISQHQNADVLAEHNFFK